MDHKINLKHFDWQILQKVGVRFLMALVLLSGVKYVFFLFNSIDLGEIGEHLGQIIAGALGAELINFPGEENPAKWRIHCHSSLAYCIFLSFFHTLGGIGGEVAQEILSTLYPETIPSPD
ncbi:MAG: hypothetical protein FJX18_01430 [Alphaproteobacteria bacterium]|nr:hypothetical protein [Alphaproteobacteria bacterium]